MLFNMCNSHFSVVKKLRMIKWLLSLYLIIIINNQPSVKEPCPRVELERLINVVLMKILFQNGNLSILVFIPDTCIILVFSPDTSLILEFTPETIIILVFSPDTSVILVFSPDTNVILEFTPDTSLILVFTPGY